MTRMKLLVLLLAIVVLPRQAAADPIAYHFDIDFQLVYGPDSLGLDQAHVELVALLNDPPARWFGPNDWLINNATLTLTGTNGIDGTYAASGDVPELTIWSNSLNIMGLDFAVPGGLIEWGAFAAIFPTGFIQGSSPFLFEEEDVASWSLPSWVDTRTSSMYDIVSVNGGAYSVPEPATMSLLGVGFALGVGFLRRRAR
jgi:hypothetical protein